MEWFLAPSPANKLEHCLQAPYPWCSSHWLHGMCYVVQVYAANISIARRSSTCSRNYVWKWPHRNGAGTNSDIGAPRKSLVTLASTAAVVLSGYYCLKDAADTHTIRRERITRPWNRFLLR